MSEAKIKIPEGMLLAALRENGRPIQDVLEAALRWLAKNPIVPTDEQACEMLSKFQRPDGGGDEQSANDLVLAQLLAKEWQRRMFREPAGSRVRISNHSSIIETETFNEPSYDSAKKILRSVGLTYGMVTWSDGPRYFVSLKPEEERP